METLAEFDAEIEQIRAQIKPLQDRLSTVIKDRDALVSLLAEDTTADDAFLATHSANNRVASDRLNAIFNAAHPMIYSAIHWVPRLNGFTEDYSHGYQVGPHLTLTKNAPAADIAALADAMTTLAGRFCPNPPQVGDRPGMILADLLDYDCGQHQSYCIWFTPEGDRAALVNQRNRYYGDPVEGTLVEVLTEAVKVAWYRQ